MSPFKELFPIKLLLLLFNINFNMNIIIIIIISQLKRAHISFPRVGLAKSMNWKEH